MMSHIMQMEEAASTFSVVLPQALIWLPLLVLFCFEQHDVLGMCFTGLNEV